LVDGAEAWRRGRDLRDGKEGFRKGGRDCGFELLQL
jgi:hypothetical protein